MYSVTSEKLQEYAENTSKCIERYSSAQKEYNAINAQAFWQAAAHHCSLMGSSSHIGDDNGKMTTLQQLTESEIQRDVKYYHRYDVMVRKHYDNSSDMLFTFRMNVPADWYDFPSRNGAADKKTFKKIHAKMSGDVLVGINDYYQHDQSKKAQRFSKGIASLVHKCNVTLDDDDNAIEPEVVGFVTQKKWDFASFDDNTNYYKLTNIGGGDTIKEYLYKIPNAASETDKTIETSNLTCRVSRVQAAYSKKYPYENQQHIDWCNSICSTTSRFMEISDDISAYSVHVRQTVCMQPHFAQEDSFTKTEGGKLNWNANENNVLDKPSNVYNSGGLKGSMIMDRIAHLQAKLLTQGGVKIAKIVPIEVFITRPCSMQTYAFVKTAYYLENMEQETIRGGGSANSSSKRSISDKDPIVISTYHCISLANDVYIIPGYEAHLLQGTANLPVEQARLGDAMTMAGASGMQGRGRDLVITNKDDKKKKKKDQQAKSWHASEQQPHSSGVSELHKFTPSQMPFHGALDARQSMAAASEHMMAMANKNGRHGGRHAMARNLKKPREFMKESREMAKRVNECAAFICSMQQRRQEQKLEK